MKTTLRNAISGLAFASALILTLQPSTTFAQGTAFTYQGRLESGGAVVGGIFDFRFSIFDAASGGALVGGPLTNSATAVSNGLFTVTLDFGAGVFSGPPRWLEIAVRTNGSGAFTTLAPRQLLSATPYAIMAANVSGVIANSSLPPDASFSGTVMADGFNGSGAALTGLDANQLTAGTVPDGRLSPNVARLNSSPTFTGAISAVGPGGDLGGVTNYPEVLGRFRSSATNGHTAVSIDASAGQDAILYFAEEGQAVWGLRHDANLNRTFQLRLHGAGANVPLLMVATNGNLAVGQTFPVSPLTVRGAGQPLGGVPGFNEIIALFTQARTNEHAGLAVNAPVNYDSVLYLSEDYRPVWDLRFDASDEHKFQLRRQLDSANAPLLTVQTNGNVGIGTTTPASPLHLHTPVGVEVSARLTSGGSWPLILNQSPASVFTITNGGQLALALFPDGRVGLGTNEPQAALHVNGTVRAAGFEGGGEPLRLSVADNQPVEVIVGGTRALRLEAGTSSPNVIGGFGGNYVADGVEGATIAGGGRAGDMFGTWTWTNRVTKSYGAVGGGLGNLVDGRASLVAGGERNGVQTNANYCAILGGVGNQILPEAQGTVIAGGSFNLVGPRVYGGSIGGGAGHQLHSPSATIAGGHYNAIETNAYYATIAGGHLNTIRSGGIWAAIPGGRENEAAGKTSLAAGYRAKANHTGTFVWADSIDADFASTSSNQFLIRASGGVGIGTTAPTRQLQVTETLTNTLTYPLKLSNEADTTNTAVGVLFQVDAGGNRGKGALVYERTDTWNRGKFHFLQEPNAGSATADLGDAVMTIANNGSVGIGTTSPTNRLHVNGGITCTVLVQTSDQNAKEDFQPVSPGEVLEKVAVLPITRWRFKDHADGPHLGPTAQDFRAAFGLGNSDTTISALDADGVALAAIQGLNEKVEARSQKSEARIHKLEAENAALKAELAELKQLVRALAVPQNGGGQ